MITLGYYAFLAAACLLALTDWRKAIYPAILLDFLRDPVRKLDSSESVVITVSVLALWGVITFSAWTRSRSQILMAFREHPKVVKAFQYLVIALIPGCTISLVLYQGGYKMVVLGVVSYLAPFAGILLGYLIALQPKDVGRIVSFYCVVNGIALISVIGEYLHFGWPALGGLKGMEWIRYSGSDVVDLIGGWYRSPDIMGLHAAQVVMFSLTLALQKSRRQSPAWIALAVFGCVCLILSGRRKMLGMPLVFLASMTLLSYARRIVRFQAILVPVVAGGVMAGGVFLVATDEYVGEEYINYAGTLFSDGAERYQELIGRSVVGTVAQSGVAGEGIGTATQGSYHIVRRRGQRFTSGGWQEDGISRIFRELGVFGVVFIAIAGWILVKGLISAVRRVEPQWHGALAQLCMISIVVANLSSFTVSHQQFSGDPPSALIVLMVLGMALGVTTLARLRNAQQAKATTS